MNMRVKRLIFYIVPFLVLAFNARLSAQKIGDGRIEIWGRQAYVSDNMVFIDMEINYFELKLGSRESVRLTPVIRGDNHRICLPPVIINGSEQHKIYRRSIVFDEREKKGDECYDKEPLAVIDIEQAPVKSYRYKTTVPLSDEIGNAVLLIETQENIGTKKSKTYEDTVGVAFKFAEKPISNPSPDVDPQLVSWVEILPVSVLNQKEFESVKGNIPLKEDELFKDASGEKLNRAIHEKLLEEVRTLREIEGLTITGIDITGYGSPADGKKNEKDVLNRALSLKNYLYESGIAANADLNVQWIAEDWEAIANVVRKSEIPLKNAVLDIILNGEPGGRGKALKNLSGSYSYEYLCREIFSEVRRVEYNITFSVSEKAKDRTLRVKDREYRLSDFFVLANAFPKGSTEFNAVYELAAKIFSDSPEAAVNAAAVALMKRDTKRAGQYLEKYATRPEALCNMGILYYLEGKAEKAEVYLELAKSLGASQASEILEAIQNKL